MLKSNKTFPLLERELSNITKTLVSWHKKWSSGTENFQSCATICAGSNVLCVIRPYLTTKIFLLWFLDVKNGNNLFYWQYMVNKSTVSTILCCYETAEDPFCGICGYLHLLSWSKKTKKRYGTDCQNGIEESCTDTQFLEFGQMKMPSALLRRAFLTKLSGWLSVLSDATFYFLHLIKRYLKHFIFFVLFKN